MPNVVGAKLHIYNKNTKVRLHKNLNNQRVHRNFSYY